MNTGKLIVVEGADGSGKTTLIENLHAEFCHRKVKNGWPDWITVREPGSTMMGEQLRKALKEDANIHPYTALCLILAARNENLQQNILPALRENKIVLVDRWDLSAAYQFVTLRERTPKTTEQTIYREIMLATLESFHAHSYMSCNRLLKMAKAESAENVSDEYAIDLFVHLSCSEKTAKKRIESRAHP
jgi:adenylate kinase family enzyme